MVNFPFLVRLHGCFQDARTLYLVLEYVVGGEFFTHLRNMGASARGALHARTSVLSCGGARCPSTPRCRPLLGAGGAVLRGGGDGVLRVPARPERHLPRPQAGEPAARPRGARTPAPRRVGVIMSRPAGAPQDHGLRLRQADRQPPHLHALRHARLPRARDHPQQGPRCAPPPPLSRPMHARVRRRCGSPTLRLSA
eukprot:scaffold1563_cov307-Prasinococcus_capsulatus_cf.AAC.4